MIIYNYMQAGVYAIIINSSHEQRFYNVTLPATLGSSTDSFACIISMRWTDSPRNTHITTNGSACGTLDL